MNSKNNGTAKKNNQWMQPDIPMVAPQVVVYRNCFRVETTAELKFDFSADEHCQLFLNGERIIDGPERGDVSYWYLQHFAIRLVPGEYCLTARVLCFGQELTAYAQVSIRHGFFVREHSNLLNTWEYQLADGCEYSKPWPDWGVFPRFTVHKNYNWNILSGKSGEWRPVAFFDDGRELHEPDLPLMRYEQEKRYHQEGNLIIFDDYVCVWAEYEFSGSGTVTIRWGENLYETSDLYAEHLNEKKGNRSGKYLLSRESIIHLNGGACRWVDYWWQAGRYLKIECDGPILEKVTFHRTGYPYQREWQVASSSLQLNQTLEMAYRTLEACSHETYMDCPHYEQLMYVGDARLEILSTYVTTSDTRLVRKALRQLIAPQQPDGLIFSRYPSKSDQIIPSFSMIYLMMLHDFALWQDDSNTVRELLPAARRIVHYLTNHLRDGLLYLPGWNFIDWLPQWVQGEPRGGECGTNSIINCFAVLALKRMAELESYVGTKDNCRQFLELSEEIERAVWKHYFDNDRGLLANDFEHRYYSEHAQLISLLSKPNPQLIAGLQREKDLEQAGIYFSFYYLEVCWQYNLPELFFQRLAKWYPMESLGLKTLPEEFDNPRSDCHAWSSHILYHYFASIMGIRPTQLGRREIITRPMTGPLSRADGNNPLMKYKMNQ